MRNNSTTAITDNAGGIQATAQQSRFHSATLDATTSADIDLHDVSLIVGDRELISGARVYLKDGVKYGLVGRNGSGKSTLLHAIVNKLIPGIPNSIRISLVSQIEQAEGVVETEVGREQNVMEHLLDSHTERRVLLEEQALLEDALDSPDLSISQRILNRFLVTRAERDLEQGRLVAKRRSGARGKKARGEEQLAEDVLEAAKKRTSDEFLDPNCTAQITSLLNDVQLSLELMDSGTFETRAKQVLLSLGFSESMLLGPYTSLSGGWRSRSRLALALLIPSDILLLDEPSNFMDLESIIWFQRYLASLPQTLIVTSHDQSFLNAITEETIALRHADLRYFPGNPGEMIGAERKEKIGKVKQQAALDKRREHIEASISEGQRTGKKTRDQNRLRMVKSRAKKLDDRWGAETSAKGTRFKLNRDLAGFHSSKRDSIKIQQQDPEIKLRLPDASGLKLPGNLISLEDVCIGYGKNDVLTNINLCIGQGERIALVGKNGQGKSTLAKVLIGNLIPGKGTVQRHSNLKLGYFDQHSIETFGNANDATPLRAFLDHFENTPTTQSPTEAAARSFLGRFSLGGKLASHTPIKLLSGGQRVRLALALLFFDPPNLLVLDEVTTHLDLATIQALGRELRSWKGGLVLITHDRSFCNIVMGHQTENTDDSDDSALDFRMPSRVYHVRKAGLRLLENGMADYELLIEKKMAKRGKI